MTAQCFAAFLLEKVTSLFGSGHGFTGDVSVCTSLPPFSLAGWTCGWGLAEVFLLENRL